MTLKFLGAATAVAVLAAAISMTSAVAQPAADGGALFRQRCLACHSVTPGARAVLAPNLAGIVGRGAASAAFNYSPALKASKLVWTRANLDRFLTSPMRMVPGTRMVISVSDAQQRAAILNYLATTR